MPRFLLSLSLFFTLTSCTDVIDLDLPQGAPLLAVDGQITDQPTPPVVTLTSTQGYYDASTPPPVRGATLTLTDDRGISDQLRETTPGRYVGSGTLLGRIGGHYRLIISAGNQTYRAETEIRPTPGIDSLVTKLKKDDGFLDDGYYVAYYGPELAGVGDFYRFKVYKNGVLFNKSEDLIVRSDELVDGRYINDVELNIRPFKAGDRVRVELNTIPRDYFYFLNEVTAQINNQGLFATSPANVRTNVYNQDAAANKAAVGYFAGYTVRADSVVVR